MDIGRAFEQFLTKTGIFFLHLVPKKVTLIIFQVFILKFKLKNISKLVKKMIIILY